MQHVLTHRLLLLTNLEVQPSTTDIKLRLCRALRTPFHASMMRSHSHRCSHHVRFLVTRPTQVSIFPPVALVAAAERALLDPICWYDPRSMLSVGVGVRPMMMGRLAACASINPGPCKTGVCPYLTHLVFRRRGTQRIALPTVILWIHMQG